MASLSLRRSLDSWLLLSWNVLGEVRELQSPPRQVSQKGVDVTPQRGRFARRGLLLGDNSGEPSFEARDVVGKQGLRG